MSQTLATQPNQPASIRSTYSATNISWWPVALFLPARLVYALAAQGITALWLSTKGSAHPWTAAAAWWPFYSTITDLLCLLSLVWLTRREGLRLIDLVGVRRTAALRELAWTPGYLLAIIPAALLASLVTRSFYGSAQPPFLTIVDLPPVAALYSILVWPLIWVIAEDLVYLGYLLPRLEAWSANISLSVLVVVFFWGLQHLAIPFLSDPTYLVSRVLAAWPATGGITLVFVLWRRRIIPIMGAHYIFDLATALLVALPSLVTR